MSLPLAPLGLFGRSLPPSFPILRSTNNHAPGTVNTSHTVNLPAGVVAGDLVVVIYVGRAGGAITDMPTPAGWTSIAVSTIPFTTVVRVIYRIADAALTTVTVTSPGTNTHIVSNSYCYSRYSNVPAASAIATDTSAAPDSPSLAPSGWGANPRVMWLSFMVIVSSVVSVTSSPTDFTDVINSNDGTSPFSRLQSARRNYRAPSLDPGAWGLSGSVLWWACTVAVRGT